jgi:hypothetical protein
MSNISGIWPKSRHNSQRCYQLRPNLVQVPAHMGASRQLCAGVWLSCSQAVDFTPADDRHDEDEAET